MQISDWASFDVRSLPLDVLKGIYHSARLELEARREISSVSKRSLWQNVKFQKLKLRGRFHGSHLKSLDQLINEDWSHLFNGGSSDPCFYVYAHLACAGPRIEHKGSLTLDMPSMPFYIGKGTGGRAWDLARNEGHGVQLRKLRESGKDKESIVYIVKDGLTEPQALELESKLIYFFGTKFEANRHGILVNLTTPPTPHK